MKYWTVEECCEILDSMRVPITASDRKSGPYPYYGANGIQDHVAEYIFDDELVLLAEDGGNFGSKERPIAYRVSGKCWVNNHAHVLKPKEGLDVDYLCYSLMFYDTSGLVNGATRQKLTQADMRKMLIPIRSITEQKGIVQRIKAIERIIESRQRQLRTLDTLIKARFVEMFGDLADPASKWPTCRLIEACDESDDIKCGPFGTQLSKDEYQESGIPVWEIPQINSTFAIAPEHFLTVEKAAQLRAYSLSVGDIVMSRKGNVGKCAIFPADKPDGILHSDVLRIRVSSKITNPCFMMCQLHYSRDIIRQIEMVSSGAIMAGVNVTKLKEIIVKMPPLELQNQFAAFVYQVDKSKLSIQQELEKLGTLKKALMQQYFG